MKTNSFTLIFNDVAKNQLLVLQRSSKKVACKAVCKALGLMEINLRHPSLNTHEFSSLRGPNGEKVLESYAQNHTPGAYRIFWHYGSKPKEIIIIAIVPHP